MKCLQNSYNDFRLGNKFLFFIYGEENGTQTNKDSKFFVIFHRDSF